MQTSLGSFFSGAGKKRSLAQANISTTNDSKSPNKGKVNKTIPSAKSSPTKKTAAVAAQEETKKPILEEIKAPEEDLTGQ